jgi:hypothetical protein
MLKKFNIIYKDTFINNYLMLNIIIKNKLKWMNINYKEINCKYFKYFVILFK